MSNSIFLFTTTVTNKYGRLLHVLIQIAKIELSLSCSYWATLSHGNVH